MLIIKPESISHQSTYYIVFSIDSLNAKHEQKLFASERFKDDSTSLINSFVYSKQGEKESCYFISIKPKLYNLIQFLGFGGFKIFWKCVNIPDEYHLWMKIFRIVQNQITSRILKNLYVFDEDTN
jgi:hypothetical protein